MPDARPGGPALTTDTPYFVASIDKLVTATAALPAAGPARPPRSRPCDGWLRAAARAHAA